MIHQLKAIIGFQDSFKPVDATVGAADIADQIMGESIDIDARDADDRDQCSAAQNELVNDIVGLLTPSLSPVNAHATLPLGV